MVAQVLVAMELYALLEETGCSPAVAEKTEQEWKDLSEATRAEHQTIRQMCAELRTCDVEDMAYEPRFQALMHTVAQHI